jgi:UDP-glucose 4-epimerase
VSGAIGTGDEASANLTHVRSADIRALVTGGAGFIGSHLVERLVDRGAHVTVVDDLSTGRLENLRGVMSQIEFDARPLAALLNEPALVLDHDIIFHLAANPYIPPSVEDPSYDFGRNLETTFRLLEVLRRAEERPRLVNTSSAAVYGNPQRLPIRESDPTVPISPYGVSKLSAERYVAVYSQLYGIPASSVRLFSVYGPRQRKQVVYDLLDRLARDPFRLEVIGDGTQERDFAYVDDVVAAMILVSQQAPATGEVYNVASGSTHSIARLVSCICDTMELRPEISYTGKVRPGDADFWSVDSSALRSLGYEARTSLVQGLRSTWDWYRAERRD